MIKEELCLTAKWYGLQTKWSAGELCIINIKGIHLGLWHPHINMNQLEWLKDKMIEEIKKNGDVSIHTTYSVDGYHMAINCGKYEKDGGYIGWPIVTGCGNTSYECWLDVILSYIRSKK